MTTNEEASYLQTLLMVAITWFYLCLSGPLLL